MKKERFLKYLILIFTLVVSFFIFTSGGVNAVDYKVNDDKITLQLDPVDATDLAKGYIIVGATTTCDLADSDCIENWVMPSSYEGNPIVAIKDSGNNLTGVLSNLSKVVSGKLTVGENIQTIGKCAFCDFDFVKEYVVLEKVTTIGEYAFAYNDALEIVNIRAYNNGIRSELSNVNAFSSTPNLSKIVFKNSTIANLYKNSVSGWKDVNITFTYKVTYRFFDNEGNLIDNVDGYVGEKLGNVPSGINITGLDFKWVSETYSNEITADSEVIESVNDVTLGPIHDVKASWSLKTANVYVATSFDGNDYEHKDEIKNVEVTYVGRNTALDITTIVDHELVGNPKFSIEYSWTRIIDGISGGVATPNLSSISVFRVADSGIYTCEITMNYEGYESVIQSVEITVKIKPKNLIVKIKDIENEYGEFLHSEDDYSGMHYVLDESTPLEDGENIEIFAFDGYYLNSNVGEYNHVLTGEIIRIGYSDDTLNNYVGNYSIEYILGNLTIIPRVIEIELNSDIELAYGDVEVLTQNYADTIYGEQKQLVIEYLREDATNKNVGTYDVMSARIINNNVVDVNYSVVIPAVNSGKIIIVPKVVEVEWELDDNLIYSGIEKRVTASYKNVANQKVDLNVAITKNDETSLFVNAGSYVITASMATVDNNYQLVEAIKNVEIEKADSVFIGSQRQVTTYNGLPQKVTVALNHNEGVVVYGDYSDCKNAHLSSSSTCTISVSAEATENYKAISGNFYLHINPYELEVEPELFEVTYGTVIGQYTLKSTYEGVNGEEVIVYFAKEGSATDLNVGYYNIVSTYLSNNTNYKAIMVPNTGANKIRVTPAPVEVKFYFYEGLVYDGNVKDIRIRYFGTEEDVGLTVDYGDKTLIKNAGDYRINVTLTNPNFYIDGKDYLEFSIAKANYDISGLKLTSVKTTFNFKSHFINLEGELPKGVIATYTIDGRQGNGTYLPFKHTVKVSFEGDYENYNYIAPLTATLNIDMSWVLWTLLLVILVAAGIPTGYILLVKYEVIKFRKKVKTRVVRKLLKRSRELEDMYAEFKAKRENAGIKDNDVEEGILAQDIDANFIKERVNTEPEELIAMSFVDELFKSSYGTKQFYSEVKNELLSYEGVVSKIKRDFETFYLNNMPIAKLDVVNGVLYTYFALDPAQYKKEEYHHTTAKEKEFTSVPLKLKVDSINSLRHAKMFVRIIRKKEGIKFVSNFVRTDYVSVYTAKESSFKLFKKAFVKKGTKEYYND